MSATTTRGFWNSAGQIDIAGADTVQDVSAGIDWALAHTPANPNAIGASCISYGVGISLLAVERDPRIKAVAALSGWADLEASLHSNRTVSQQGVWLWVGAGALNGRPGPNLAQIGARVAIGDYDGAVQAFLPWVALRSPATDVAALNARGTAVLLGNAFNDGLERLTKRLRSPPDGRGRCSNRHLPRVHSSSSAPSAPT